MNYKSDWIMLIVKILSLLKCETRHYRRNSLSLSFDAALNQLGKQRSTRTRFRLLLLLTYSKSLYIITPLSSNLLLSFLIALQTKNSKSLQMSFQSRILTVSGQFSRIQRIRQILEIRINGFSFLQLRILSSYLLISVLILLSIFAISVTSKDTCKLYIL